MGDCCEAGTGAAVPCPECGGAGRAVDRITLKALLCPAALARMLPGSYRFFRTVK